MPTPSKALVALAALALLAACQRQAPVPIGGAPAPNPAVTRPAPVTGVAPGEPNPTTDDGCNPQVPATFRISQLASSTTLEIQVTTALGQPKAGVDVRAIRQLPSGYRCPSQVDAQTGPDGMARIERLKPGPYKVLVIGDNASAVELELVAGRPARTKLVAK